MMLIDTHIHLDDKAYQKNLDEVVGRADEAGIKYFINPGSDLKSNKTIPDLVKKYPRIIPAFGIHPHEAKTFDDEILKFIKGQIAKFNAVAVGEIGLDFHYNFSNPDIQKDIFIKQLQLAKEFNLPVIIHCRLAENEVYEILKKEGISRGVIHCFSGNAEEALKFLSLGFYIGITGVVTFPKAVKTKEVVKNIPLDSILTETDGPYLAPVPFRGKRNEPSFIPYILKEIAGIKSIPEENASRVLFENAKKCFGILK